MKKLDYFMISKDQIAKNIPKEDLQKDHKGIEIYNVWTGQHYAIKILEKDEEKNYKTPTPLEWKLFKKNTKSIADAVKHSTKTKLT